MIQNDIRVMQLSAAYAGAQKQIEDAIHDRLKADGIDCRVLYMVGNNENPDYIKCERKIEQFIRRLCYKYATKSYRFSRIQTRRIIKEIDLFKPSIFHIHAIHHGYVDFPYLFRYLRLKNIKIIFTVHDMWPFTGGCYHFTSINCNGYTTGCNNCKNRQEFHDCRVKNSKKLLDKKLNCYKGQKIVFVAVSEWVKEMMGRSLIKQYPAYVIQNCVPALDNERVDTEYSDRLSKIIQNRHSLAFIAASWNNKKGYDIICSLAELLGDQYILLLAGNASPEQQKSAKRNMVFLGYLSGDKLESLLSVCDLHVSASKEETFGMTFVEAAFSGTRSVGFASTAVEETLKSVGGFLVYDLSAEGLKRTIVQNISCPKLDENEIDQIKNKYSIKRMTEEYLNVYFNMSEQLET